MKTKTLLYVLSISAVLFFGSAKSARAVSMTPRIGSNETLNQSFTTDVDVNNLNVGGLYQLVIYKHANDAPAGSWQDFCHSPTGSTIWLVAGINFGWDNSSIPPYLSLTNAFGGINEVARTADGKGITLRFSVNFDKAYDKAYLIYALVPVPDFNTQIGDVQNCGRLALYDIKQFKVSDTGGGGGTTPVEIPTPETVAAKLGTAKVSGTSFRFLRNLFPGGRTSGHIDQEVQTFPVLGTVLTALLYLAGLLLLIGVIYSGIILMRATSDEEAATAKKNLTWALTGAFIVVIANWLVDTIIRFLSQ